MLAFIPSFKLNLDTTKRLTCDVSKQELLSLPHLVCSQKISGDEDFVLREIVKKKKQGIHNMECNFDVNGVPATEQSQYYYLFLILPPAHAF